MLIASIKGGEIPFDPRSLTPGAAYDPCYLPSRVETLTQQAVVRRFFDDGTPQSPRQGLQMFEACVAMSRCCGSKASNWRVPSVTQGNLVSVMLLDWQSEQDDWLLVQPV